MHARITESMPLLMNEQRMLQAALSYAAMGWRVFPLKPRGKTPLTENGQDDSTIDADTICSWWSRWPAANIGLHLEPAGLCAVDVDPRNGGSVDLLPDMPDTLTAATGGGGRHILFRIPDGVTVPGKLAPGIDLKRRGYIVVEPSVHESGQQYSWLDWQIGDPEPVIAAAPEWVLQRVVPGQEPPPESKLNLARAVREILHAEHYHENLIRLAAHFVVGGVRSYDVIAILRGVMDAVRVKDDRWRERYDEIPRSVTTAISKFLPGGVEPIEAPLPAALEALTAADFVSRLRPPEYVWEGILQRAYLYAITGHSGSGKTAIVLALMVAMAIGRPYAGHDTVRGRVLYVAGENPDDVRMRVVALLEAWGVEVDDLGDYLMFVETPLTLPERHTDLIELADRIEPIVIVFDTDQAVAGSDEENDNSERVAHAKRVREYTKIRSRPCVLDLCHCSAAATKANMRPRGASSFLAEIDGNIGIWKEPDGNVVEMYRTSKFRGPEFDAMEFEMRQFSSTRLADADGVCMVSVVATPLTAAAADDLDSRSRERRLLILEDISKCPVDSVRVRGTRLGIPKSGIDRGVAELEKQGYVTKTPDGYDLTPRGKRWLVNRG